MASATQGSGERDERDLGGAPSSGPSGAGSGGGGSGGPRSGGVGSERSGRAAASGGASGDDDRAPVPFTQQLGRATVVVLAVLFGIFAVTNAQRVAFSWVFGRTEPVTTAAGTTGGVPLIVLLVLSFVVGATTVALVSRRGPGRR